MAAHHGVRSRSRPRRQLVGRVAAHAGAFGPRLPARKSPCNLAPVSAGFRSARRTATGFDLQRNDGRPAGHVPRGRAAAHRPADARPVQRNLLRARVPRALPRRNVGRRQRPHRARPAALSQDLARLAAGARPHQAARRPIPGSARTAPRLDARRTGLATGYSRRQPSRRQHAGLGVPRIAGAPWVLARTGASAHRRKAAATRLADLVVRRARGHGSRAAAAWRLRHQAHLPRLQRAHHLRGSARQPVGSPRTRRVGRPHRATGRSAHRSKLPAAVADADLDGRPQPRPHRAACHAAARLRSERRRTVLARTARRPGEAHRLQRANRVDAAWRQQCRRLGTNARRGRPHHPAATARHARVAGAPSGPGHEPCGRTHVLAGPLHRTRRKRRAFVAPHPRSAARRRPVIAPAPRLAASPGAAQCTGATRRSERSQIAPCVRARAHRRAGQCRHWRQRRLQSSLYP